MALRGVVSTAASPGVDLHALIAPPRPRPSRRLRRSQAPSPAITNSDELLEPIRELGNRDTLLLRGVSLADRHRPVVQGVEVDRHAEGGADLVLAPVAPADVTAGLVVLDPKLALQL